MGIGMNWQTMEFEINDDLKELLEYLLDWNVGFTANHISMDALMAIKYEVLLSYAHHAFPFDSLLNRIIMEISYTSLGEDDFHMIANFNKILYKPFDADIEAHRYYLKNKEYLKELAQEDDAPYLLRKFTRGEFDMFNLTLFNGKTGNPLKTRKVEWDDVKELLKWRDKYNTFAPEVKIKVKMEK